jgi:hypothetical protein
MIALISFGREGFAIDSVLFLGSEAVCGRYRDSKSEFRRSAHLSRIYRWDEYMAKTKKYVCEVGTDA